MKTVFIIAILFASDHGRWTYFPAGTFLTRAHCKQVLGKLDVAKDHPARCEEVEVHR
jgi:hypothetical protein